MDVLSKSEFAARKGWSKAYVSKLVRLDRLVLTQDGKVDVLATESLLVETSDPSKGGVTQRHERDRINKGVTAHTKPDAPSAQAADLGSSKFQTARAHREHFLSLLAENEYRKSIGELTETAAVEKAAFATGRMLRDLLLGLPKQIAPELSALSDPWEVERLLTTGIRRVLEDADRISASDLENAIKPTN